MAKDYDFFDPPDPRLPQSDLPKDREVRGEGGGPADGHADGRNGRTPFATIWLRPRQTIRAVVTRDASLHVVPLVGLSGVGGFLGQASTQNVGREFETADIVATAFIFGPLMSLFVMWAFSHLIRLSGGWLGGFAPREHLRAAIAWASVPAVASLPLWIPMIAIAGREMFAADKPRLEQQPGLLHAVELLMVSQAVLGFWGFVLLCNAVAEVQGFRSAWKGLGNLLIAFCLLVAIGGVILALLRPLILAAA